MVAIDSVVARERSAVSAHRASLRGAALPSPSDAPRGTFLHGLLLPFSLIVATLRDRELRSPYLRITAFRILAVGVLTALALGSSSGSSASKKHGPSASVVVHHGSEKTDDAPATGAPSSKRGVHVDVPGIHVDIDTRKGEKSAVRVLGKDVPVVDVDEGAAPTTPITSEAKMPPPALASVASKLERGWGFLLALLAAISATTAIVVALSRRYDDRLSFFAARLATIVPEDAEAPKAKIALDLKWLYKKIRRRIRGYVVFGAGVPLLALLMLLPTVGEHAFHVALVLWGWYWLGVFTAAKSAHAWADEDTAPSPSLIRAFSEAPRNRVTAPVRAYGRLWAWLTRGVNAPAAAFERTPAAFLGLALARVILSLPGLYLLARPIVPIAAGRLIAEADPFGRFAMRSSEEDTLAERAGFEPAVGF